MALRTKTIHFAIPTDITARASGTRVDSASFTVYIPETTSRTFLSVIMEMTTICNSAGATTALSSRLLGVKLGAAATGDQTLSLTNTVGMNLTSTVMSQRDVTSYFTSNFGAGASQTCVLSVVVTGGGTRINTTCKLIITYQFDDAAQTTRIKTVAIPFESPTASLTTTLTEIGTNQWPALDTFLPESSKVYRQVFLETNCSIAESSNTAHTLSLALDSEAEVADGSVGGGGNGGSPYYRYHWIRNDATTNAAHAFKARATGVSAYQSPSFVLWVTYEYDHGASTSILNSVRLLMPMDQWMGGSASADASLLSKKFYIEEPATIALVQSAVAILFETTNQVFTSGWNILCGSQTARNYTSSGQSGEAMGGPWGSQQRIDSGGAQGAGITLARGENTFNCTVYRGSTTMGMGLTALLYLNYTSGKASSGADTHNRTLEYYIADMTLDPSPDETITSAVAPSIGDTSWYASAVGVWFERIYDSTNTSHWVAALMDAELQSGEGAGAGWRSLALPEVMHAGAGAGSGRSMAWVDCSALYTRHPTDPDASRMVLTTARKYRFASSGITGSWHTVMSGRLILTIHSIPFTVADSVIGYTGDGSGITIGIHRSDTGELVQTTTTSAGGSFSATWYDNVGNVYCEAQQDATHVGRSSNSVAV